MKARRVLWVALTALAVGWLSLLASGVWAFQRYGMVGVRVDDRGTHVRLAVPGALVHWSLRAAEMARWQHAWRPRFGAAERRHLEFARRLVAELANCPDAVYVRVESDRQSVRVAKQDGYLDVRVLDGEERVHVTIPTALASRAVEFAARFAAAGRVSL